MKDILGIGFGPANIALAVALTELAPDLDVTFVEARDDASWQPNMLLDRADIQNNPVRDLVTPRNPRSRFTFINYLHENGRLFKHLNLPSEFPLRKEYAQYIKWVAENVGAHVDYSCTVASLHVDGGRQPIVTARTADGAEYRARAVVVAPGRTPYVPGAFADLPLPVVSHTSRYLAAIADLPADWDGVVALIGSSQSSIEVLLDLRSRLPQARITNIMSGFGYRLKDTSPFSEEVYFPTFVDYYFGAGPEGKQVLRDQLRATNYSTADRDVLDELYLRLYEDELDGVDRVSLVRNRQIVDARIDSDARVQIQTIERITGEHETITADRVVLATGYRDLGARDRNERLPALLSGLGNCLDRDGLKVGRDYRLQTSARGPAIYLNGLCESTHGLGDAGSFSLLALRSKTIVDSIQQYLATVDEPQDASRASHRPDKPKSKPLPQPIDLHRRPAVTNRIRRTS